MSEWDSTDEKALCFAVGLLEFSSFAMDVMNLIGRPIEKLAEAASTPRVQRLAKKALLRALHLAVKTLGKKRGPHDRIQKWTTGVLGAVSGAAGWLGLAAELPITTLITLRSIAEIARSEEQDLNDLKARFNCLAVFALSSSNRSDKTESSYYLLRKELDQDILAAVGQMMALRAGLARVVARGQFPKAVIELVERIAVRFGEVIATKFAAQGPPLLGAAGGMTVNVIFTSEFQKKAHGHFTVLRLERKYGLDAVRNEYEKCLSEIRATGRCHQACANADPC